jgi:hypothetical protein
MSGEILCAAIQAVNFGINSQYLVESGELKSPDK